MPIRYLVNNLINKISRWYSSSALQGILSITFLARSIDPLFEGNCFTFTKLAPQMGSSRDVRATIKLRNRILSKRIAELLR